MDLNENLSHRIRIEQLASRNLPGLAREYMEALSSEEALNEFLEKLGNSINQIHDVVLFLPEFSGMMSTLILRIDLRNTPIDEQLLQEAARVYVSGFYNKPTAIIPYEHLSKDQFQRIYLRGKRKYT